MPGRGKPRPGFFVPARGGGPHPRRGCAGPGAPFPRRGKGGGKGAKTRTGHKKTAQHGPRYTTGGIAARWAASAKRTRQHHTSTCVSLCQAFFRPEPFNPGAAANKSGPFGPLSRPRDGGGPGARRATHARRAGARQGGPGAARDGRSGPRRGPRGPHPRRGPRIPMKPGPETCRSSTQGGGAAAPQSERSEPGRRSRTRAARRAGPLLDKRTVFHQPDP